MTDKINFDFRQVTPENLERFSEMARLCLGSNAFDASYFKWKYLNNPAGHVVAYEAVHEGEPAALFSIIPEFFLINGEEVKIYQGMDVMTHPKYQRRGLFSKVANMACDHIAEREGSINIFGFPGIEALYGVIKLGWKNLHTFSYYFAHRNWFTARNSLRRVGGLEFKAVTEMSPQLTRYFVEREASPKPISSSLSADYFDWRVFQNRYQGLKTIEVRDGDTVVGVCVYTWELEKKRIRVHLLDFLRQEFFGSHPFSVMRDLFTETGARYIYTWEPLNETLRAAYARCGFVKNPLERGPFSYRVPFVVLEQGQSASTANWFDPNNFDIQPLAQH